MKFRVFLADADSLATSIDKLDMALKDVVESGSNANGTYIKFSDGTMICTGTFVDTLAVNNATGALWFAYKAWTFPVAFNAVPTYVDASFAGSTVLIGAGSSSISTTSMTYHVLATASQASIAVTSRCIAVGRWKA